MRSGREYVETQSSSEASGSGGPWSGWSTEHNEHSVGTVTLTRECGVDTSFPPVTKTHCVIYSKISLQSTVTSISNRIIIGLNLFECHMYCLVF